MRVLLHITYSGSGGMTEAVLTLLEAASFGGDLRHFVLFYGADALPDSMPARCESLGISYAYIQKEPGKDLLSLFKVFSLLRNLKPEVVYSHMTQPFPALLMHRLIHRDSRFISIEHHSNALKSSKDWALTCANHLFADHSVYLTSQYRDEVSRHLQFLFRPGKASVIANGIDTNRFSPGSTTPSPVPFLIGMSARMVPGKDFETLLRAFRILFDRAGPARQLRLQLAGDGPQRETWETLARDLGISPSVDFLGELTQQELIRAMRSWQIFVLSTLGETMSRSIMEAQSLGLPIISTAVPGVLSAIESGNTGILVRPQAPDDLARALHSLMDSPSLRADLGRSARDKALREYSSGEIWRRYCELSHSLFSN